ncbi:restriction endonuclease [Nocardiopsis ansamitocini]|uniref:Restriction endonuclease type IV Mrr domain-containing protein n=1 Tax=Nocardiopsis ansamitocini TaxID=1670832 RepID=A0A9W6UJD9_9ACTN|nr:restriction endonuclease [Nocardiopsis ansamitocini]GLU48408.1 hypothetical protein Nans01_27590 [Nocardiopsis ansamitocini]
MKNGRTGSRPGRRSRWRRLGGAIPWWAWLFVVGLLLRGAAWIFTNVEHLWLWLLGVAAIAALTAWAVVKVRRVRSRAWLAAHADLEMIDSLPGPDFETYVAELLRRDGHARVRVQGGAGDGGVDILGVTPRGERFVVQCKRYSRPVAPAAVREFQGVLHTTHRDHIGVFVASNGFSAAARQAGTGIILIDRPRLALWARGRVPLTLDEDARAA